MFINKEDYHLVVSEISLKTIMQQDEANLTAANAAAIEEISGYLRPKYDLKTIFSAEGDNRNRQLVMTACDIALYHLNASMPQKMGAEIRKERYDRAVKWLEGVQAAKIILDLPLSVNESTGEPSGLAFRFGCQEKQHNNW